MNTMPVTIHHIADKVLDLLLDTVCVVDDQGRFAFLSASCENLLGYTQEELLGRRMIDLVLPVDRERTLKAAGRVMEGRSHIHFENRYVRKDGRVVDIMWSARWSETERMRFAVARDITELKHAERKQRALYEISKAPMMLKTWRPFTIISIASLPVCCPLTCFLSLASIRQVTGCHFRTLVVTCSGGEKPAFLVTSHGLPG